MAPTVARAIFCLFKVMMASLLKPWDYMPWGGAGYDTRAANRFKMEQGQVALEKEI